MSQMLRDENKSYSFTNFGDYYVTNTRNIKKTYYLSHRFRFSRRKKNLHLTNYIVCTYVDNVKETMLHEIHASGPSCLVLFVQAIV